MRPKQLEVQSLIQIRAAALDVQRFEPGLKVSEIGCLLGIFIFPFLPFLLDEICERPWTRLPDVCRDRLLKIDAMFYGGHKPQFVICVLAYPVRPAQEQWLGAGVNGELYKMLTQARDGKAQMLEVLPVARVLREGRKVHRLAFDAMQRMQNFKWTHQ